MYLNSFFVIRSEGIKFAKLSGDDNLIHLSKTAGYNSIYGHDIVHGILIILKFFKKIKLKKNYSFININFEKGFEYDFKIKINKIKKNKSKNIFYELVQKNDIKANIEIKTSFEKFIINNKIGNSCKKNYFITDNIKKINSNDIVPAELKIALNYLSKYVGKVYPGKNSLIKEISIYNSRKNNDDKLSINSSLISRVFPLINNFITYKNYYIEFKTFIRPELKIKLKKPKNKILKEVNSIKENVLIIGGSSGIGNDLLKLFLNNKKIKIIATYYKNNIALKNKNLILKKINIETDLKAIYKIIKKFNPILIYYFPTPKIFFKSIKDKNLIKKYRKYFIEIPIKIIRFSQNFKLKFFYPSTTYANIGSPYSLIKSQAEKKINKLNESKIKVNILKIPGINTKQNLSLIDQKLPNFRDLLARNRKIFKKTFFKN